MIRWLRRFRLFSKGQHLANEDRPEAALIASLAGQVSTPQRAGAVLDAVETFQRLPRSQQVDELPGIYLLLEQYLTDIDPLRKLTRVQLRESVRDHFSFLLASEPFGLIFETSSQQEVLLCRAFMMDMLRRAMTVLGATGDNRLAVIHGWLVSVPASTQAPVLFGQSDDVPGSDEEWLQVLTNLSYELYQELGKSLGEAVDRIYDASYQHVARQYAGLETFPVVIGLLPDKLLDENRIQSLARHRTLERVQGALSAAQSVALETAAQLQAVLNTVGEGIITINADGLIVLVNQEVEQIFGYAQADLIGTALSRLLNPMAPDSASRGTPYVGNWQSWGVPGQRVEVDGIRSDGSVFPLEVCINETRIAGRLFYTAAVRDITGRKEFERELIVAKEHAEEMTRLKTIFLGNISHELRTPLTGIMGFAQVLGEEVTEEQREFTRLIHDCGRRLLETLNSVLEYARLESGQVELRPQRIEVVSRISNTVELFRIRAEEKGLALGLVSSEGSLFADVDSVALDRVVSSLMENAIKFTEHGAITVELAAQPEGLRISVRDTGSGISPEFIRHLFDEFRQESIGLSRSHEGAGLGLAIAKRLIGVMQGDITVESEKQKGTTFTITLPNAVEALAQLPA
jgi:PAS domain S-box-containing protein